MGEFVTNAAEVAAGKKKGKKVKKNYSSGIDWKSNSQGYKDQGRNNGAKQLMALLIGGPKELKRTNKVLPATKTAPGIYIKPKKNNKIDKPTDTKPTTPQDPEPVAPSGPNGIANTPDTGKIADPSLVDPSKKRGRNSLIVSGGSGATASGLFIAS